MQEPQVNMQLICLAIWLSGFCLKLFHYSRYQPEFHTIYNFIFFEFHVCFIGDEPTWITFCNMQMFIHIPKKYIRVRKGKDENESGNTKDS